MSVAGALRERLAQTLTAAYGDGLISDDTLHARLDDVLQRRLIDVNAVVGDLPAAAPARPRGLRGAVLGAVTLAVGRLEALRSAPVPPTILALDWTGGEQDELIVGRSGHCDVWLGEPSVSRRHLRLNFRAGNWIVQDLASTNGTYLNGRRIGRGTLHPGDLLELGSARVQVD